VIDRPDVVAACSISSAHLLAKLLSVWHVFGEDENLRIRLEFDVCADGVLLAQEDHAFAV
jgi:hypothetical protein